jgi:tRNA dimethylallyltransferase
MLELPLIVIAGTNASGKSTLAIKLALEFNGEIVSADSRQVYKELDLCAGKVGPDERKLVPHHLLDIVDLNENFTLGSYLPLAQASIEDIAKRNRTPFLVGGTGLYISAVVENYLLPPVPPNPALRQKLESMDTESLLSMLWKLDPDTARIMDVRNPRGLTRPLEVCIATGQPFSKLRRVGPAQYRSLTLSLDWPRAILHERIDARVDRRIRQGMIEEVEDQLRKGVSVERLHQLGLEYRIISEYLMGMIPTQSEMVAKLKFAIHAFARRQLTWFRRKKYIHWLNASEDYEAEAKKLIQQFLATIRQD